MTTENTYRGFFGSNGCLSLQGYRAVIAGEISGAAFDHVNAHLESCELCRETLEGLRQNPDDAAIARGVKNLVDKFQQPKTVIRPLYYAISAAAVILFAVGLGYQAYKGSEEKEMDKAFANEFKPYPAPSEESTVTDGGMQTEQLRDIAGDIAKKETKSQDDPAVVKNITPEKPRPGVSSMDAVQEDLSIDVPEKEEQDEVIITDTKSPKDNQYAAPVATGSSQTISPAQIRNAPVSATEEYNRKSINKSSEDDVTLSESRDLESVAVVSGSRKKQKPEKQKSVPQPVSPQYADEYRGKSMSGTEKNDSVVVSNMAMDSYRKGDFARAAKLFDEILTSDPMYNDARFYGGISWLETGNTKKAISYFRILATTTGHSFSYPAKWYLSLALIKEKKKDEALIYLDELSGIPGEYQQRAKDLANTIR